MEVACNIMIMLAFAIGVIALWQGDDHEPY